MRPLHFIDPYGLVTLCLMARYGDALSSRVVFHLPEAFALRTYLGRVRFAEAVDEVELAGPTLIVDQEREKEESEALLEITRIEERTDIETVLGKIGQRVEAILAEELRYTEVEINQFKNVVAELCHNILDHSENWGYLTAQRYLNSRVGKKYVVIGVGISGSGSRRVYRCATMWRIGRTARPYSTRCRSTFPATQPAASAVYRQSDLQSLQRLIAHPLGGYAGLYSRSAALGARFGPLPRHPDCHCTLSARRRRVSNVRPASQAPQTAPLRALVAVGPSGGRRRPRRGCIRGREYFISWLLAPSYWYSSDSVSLILW